MMFDFTDKKNPINIIFVVIALVAIIFIPSTFWGLLVKLVLTFSIIFYLFHPFSGVMIQIFKNSKSGIPVRKTEEKNKKHQPLESSESDGIEADFEKYVENFIQAFHTILNGNTTAIFLYHKGKNIFKSKIHISNSDSHFLASKEISDDSGLFHILLKNQAEVIENDISLDARFLPYYSQSLNKTGAVAFFPVKYRQDIIGAVTVDITQKNSFTPDYLSLARQMIAQFEIQFRSSNFLFELQSETEKNKSFMEITNTFNNTLYFDQIWEHTQVLLNKYITADRMCIILTENYNPSNTDDAFIHEIWGVSGGLQDGYNFKLNDGIVSWCIINRKPFNINDLFKRNTPAYRFNKQENSQLQIRSMLIIPIQTPKLTFGALMLESQEPYQYTAQDKTLVQFLADQIGHSLERTIQFEKLSSHVQKDNDSGIWNYDSFKDRLVEEIERSKRFKSQFSIVLFKIKLNSEPHATEIHEYFPVLKNLINKMQTQSRSVDWFAKVDQFHMAVILFETPIMGAEIYAKKLLAEIEKEIMTDPNNQGRYSVNAAITNYPEISTNIESILGILQNGIISLNDENNKTVIVSEKE